MIIQSSNNHQTSGGDCNFALLHHLTIKYFSIIVFSTDLFCTSFFPIKIQRVMPQLLHLVAVTLMDLAHNLWSP